MSQLEAKRIAPPTVSPVSYQGIVYSAPVTSMGVVEAKNEKDQTILWSKSIYTVKYEEGLETDVQDVFITKLAVKNNMLLVTNEKNKQFEVDLKTGQVSSEKTVTPQTFWQKYKMFFIIWVLAGIVIVPVLLYILSGFTG